MIRFALLAFIALVAGCASQRPAYVTSAPFNAESARKLLQPGSNTIKGSALLRQQGGGVVTCAGGPVYLVPATEYATERMRAIYSSDQRGFDAIGYGGKHAEFDHTPAEYLRLQRESRCDAQGFFKFDRLADGSFFVVTAVAWRVGTYTNAGGWLMQRVQVAGAEIKEVVLAL